MNFGALELRLQGTSDRWRVIVEVFDRWTGVIVTLLLTC